MPNKIYKHTSVIYSLKILTHICRFSTIDLNKTILYDFKIKTISNKIDSK